MTPKEKAKELFDKMYKYSFEPEYNKSKEVGLPEYYNAGDFEIHCAKQCALIAIDECLYTCIPSRIYYWQEVKQELINL